MGRCIGSCMQVAMAVTLIEIAAYWWKGFSKFRMYESICYHMKETENGSPGNGYQLVCSRRQGKHCCSIILARGLMSLNPAE